MAEKDQKARLQRWRLLLGGGEADGTGEELPAELVGKDQVLSELYDADPKDRKSGLGNSNPQVNRWLGDIRKYFPSSVVQIMQQDAMDRLGLKEMLFEPELLSQLEPDVHLAATLISLKNVIPDRTQSTARIVVEKVVKQLEKRLRLPLKQSIKGALDKSRPNRKPRFKEINWHRTILRNLQHYQPKEKRIIPATWQGYSRINNTQKEIILLLDQSGSMASSVVYASVVGAVLASIRSIKTHMLVFDTQVVDLTAKMQSPVDLLFGVQLGGGTDIRKAIQYSRQLIRRPRETIMVLISDLFEGGRRDALLQEMSQLVQNGVQVISLLALSDEGKPAYDAQMASAFRQLDIPVFACTPDHFPRLMADAMNGKKLVAPG